MNISILFDGDGINSDGGINSDNNIKMEANTQIRNNREIFKASPNIKFNQTGKIIVYENNVEKQSIDYSIDISGDDSKWYQLNSLSDTYVFQVKLQNINDQLTLSKIAVQKLLGRKNRLINI